MRKFASKQRLHRSEPIEDGDTLLWQKLDVRAVIENSGHLLQKVGVLGMQITLVKVIAIDILLEGNALQVRRCSRLAVNTMQAQGHQWDLLKPVEAREQLRNLQSGQMVAVILVSHTKTIAFRSNNLHARPTEQAMRFEHLRRIALGNEIIHVAELLGSQLLPTSGDDKI